MRGRAEFSGLLNINRGNFFCDEACWENDFKHFDVVAVAEFAMPDIWRLMNAGACFEADDALALVLKFNPALEDVNQLKLRLMHVWLTGELLSSCCSNYVGINTALRCAPYSQIAIFVKGTKTSFELSIQGV